MHKEREHFESICKTSGMGQSNMKMLLDMENMQMTCATYLVYVSERSSESYNWRIQRRYSERSLLSGHLLV